MKKLILLFGAFAILSCNGEKKEKDASSEESKAAVNSYSVVFQGLYEKDDEITIQYKKDGYIQYETPVVQKVTGQPVIQRIEVAIPQGVAMENLQFLLSNNKEQEKVQLKSVSIFNDGKEVFNGDNFTYLQYFNGNTGVIMDEPTQTFKLDFSGQFPPGFTGNEQLEAILVK